MKKRKKKLEFSKKIFYIVITIFVIVTVYSMALMWKTDDTSALSYLIPSVGGLAATSCGFYYHKSKVENVIKLKKETGMDLDEIKELEEEVSDYDVTVDDINY